MQKTVEIPQVAVLAPRCRARLVHRQVLVQTVQKTVELPQVQLLWCCVRHCDHAAFVPAVQSFDRVLDIPVVPQQFLNKVVDACAHGSDSARQFTDKVVDIPVLALFEWRCLRFSHRQSSMTI